MNLPLLPVLVNPSYASISKLWVTTQVSRFQGVVYVPFEKPMQYLEILGSCDKGVYRGYETGMDFLIAFSRQFETQLLKDIADACYGTLVELTYKEETRVSKFWVILGKGKYEAVKRRLAEYIKLPNASEVLVAQVR